MRNAVAVFALASVFAGPACIQSSNNIDEVPPEQNQATIDGVAVRFAQIGATTNRDATEFVTGKKLIVTANGDDGSILTITFADVAKGTFAVVPFDAPSFSLILPDGTGTESADGTIDVTVADGLAPGSALTLSVQGTVRDGCGNTHDVSASLHAKVDNTLPQQVVDAAIPAEGMLLAVEVDEAPPLEVFGLLGTETFTRNSGHTAWRLASTDSCTTRAPKRGFQIVLDETAPTDTIDLATTAQGEVFYMQVDAQTGTFPKSYISGGGTIHLDAVPTFAPGEVITGSIDNVDERAFVNGNFTDEHVLVPHATFRAVLGR